MITNDLPSPHSGEPPPSRPWQRDAMVPLAAVIVVGGLAIAFDAADRWCLFAARSGVTWLDEVLILMALIGLAIGWTALCRLRVHARLAATMGHHDARLRATNRELEGFSYAVSHDLRAPLRILNGYLDLLRRRAGDRLDDRERMFLDEALRGAHHMDVLINAMLDYARAGGAPLEVESIDLESLVDDMFLEAAPRLRDVGGTASRAALPRVRASRVHLTRVLRNLIDNAVKYRAPTRPLILRVTGRAVDDRVEIRVADNGRGIPEGARERVFQLFQRLEPDDGMPGTGVGLALCRRILERHGGRLDLVPTVGGGCTFVLALPI